MATAVATAVEVASEARQQACEAALMVAGMVAAIEGVLMEAVSVEVKEEQEAVRVAHLAEAVGKEC